MVLSHSDVDHLGAVDEILDAYKVKKIICLVLDLVGLIYEAAGDPVE